MRMERRVLVRIAGERGQGCLRAAEIAPRLQIRTPSELAVALTHPASRQGSTMARIHEFRSANRADGAPIS